MIVIDKLCYRSRLRYVNASEKFLYTVVTLVICVAGRSPAAAAAAFAVNGILTVRKGGIPLSRYIKLLMVPLAFLILGSAAVIVNISKTPLDAFAFPVGDWYITGSRDSVTDGALLWAVALSAVIFGAYHGNVMQFVYAGLLGLAFGLIMCRTNSLRVVITAHVAANIWSLVGSVLEEFLRQFSEGAFYAMLGCFVVMALLSGVYIMTGKSREGK